MSISERGDLLRLNPAALAALANVGLVKRASKELAAGDVPTIGIAEHATVVATFASGVQVRLPPDTALRDCPCSCGAPMICRHRIGAILAYQQWAGARATDNAASTQPPAPAAAPAPVDAWWPAQVSDAAMQQQLGERVVAEARKLWRAGALAVVHGARAAAGEPPWVETGAANVRFLVAGDLRYARCDCQQKSGCAHVAIAVWAFRAALARGARPEVAAVQLGESADVGAPARTALAAARDLGYLLLTHGVARLPAAAAARFAAAKAQLAEAHLIWPLGVVADLEDQAAAYARRSALYASSQLAATLAELFARYRALNGGGEMAPALLLGSDEVAETALAHTRLVALGARVEADGAARLVSLYFAEALSPTVMVLRHRFEVAADDVALGRRQVLGGYSLEQLASGQLVTDVARRRANRQIVLARGDRLRGINVLRGGDVLSSLPPGLCVSSSAGFAASLRQLAPRLLRPRLLAERVRAFMVGAVLAVHYDVAAQTVVAHCRDAAQGELQVVLGYRAAAPAALQALTVALTSAPVRAVIGEGRRRGGALVVEPLAVVTEQLVVLDLAAPSPDGVRALAALPHLPAAAPTKASAPVAAVLATAWQVLADVPHYGLHTLAPAWRAQVGAVGQQLADFGFSAGAAAMYQLEQGIAAAGVGGNESSERAACEAWATAALRLELLTESLGEVELDGEGQRGRRQLGAFKER